MPRRVVIRQGPPPTGGQSTIFAPRRLSPEAEAERVRQAQRCQHMTHPAFTPQQRCPHPPTREIRFTTGQPYLLTCGIHARHYLARGFSVVEIVPRCQHQPGPGEEPQEQCPRRPTREIRFTNGATYLRTCDHHARDYRARGFQVVRIR